MGNLLQIVDELPSGQASRCTKESTDEYTLIDCCFADMWQKARYFFETFGMNEDDLILTGEFDENENEKLYEAAALTFWGERRFVCHIKAERKDGKVAMSGVTIQKQPEASE